MKRNRIQNRCIATCLTLIAMLMMSVGVKAQNVTIKANNGSLIASRPVGSSDYDTFFKCGGFATWQHNQLSMVLTASDATTLTDYGQLKNPANNLFSSGTKIQIGKGYSDYPTCYLSLSLPKGYRFTGYTIKFSKSSETKTLNGGESIDFNESGTSRFGETGSNFNTYTNYGDVTIGSESKTITRTSLAEDGSDMGNVLYFKLQNTSNNSSNRALITLESAEFFFTAEADYAALIAPNNVNGKKAVDVEFFTSKVDYGTLEKKQYGGITRPSYGSANVKDLKANLTLYEADAIKNGSNFDGSTGDVVNYDGSGTISSNGQYFQLGDGTTTEKIYYIETPTYVLLSDNTTKNPVGYRIVGAQFDYQAMAPHTEMQEMTLDDWPTFSISATRDGTTYYISETGGITSTYSQRAIWFMDDKGFIRLVSTPTTYLRSGNNNHIAITTGFNPITASSLTAYTFAIEDGEIIYKPNNTKLTLRYYYRNRILSADDEYFYFTNSSVGNRIYDVDLPSEGSQTITADVLTTVQDPFTLNVYNPNGEGVKATSSSEGSSIIVDGYNNDAIKIGVSGKGLVKGSITMQALDPYLYSMDVVCQDRVQTEIRLHQNFTASDFSVSGGEFYFYLPTDCNTHRVDITFENLDSQYFDETYEGGSTQHTSRINFVKSNHYNTFGLTNNNIYNSRSEASNAQQERQEVGIVGNARFKFNNAAEVGANGGTLTEYPFSLENYAESPNNGSFGLMSFTVSADDQQQTKYVFTTDETRYNIAPTTATQHRAYAFYEMIVHVQTQLYEPQVAFTKIYDKNKTLYGTGQTTAFYGATVTAYDGNTPPKPGYASVSKIYDKIAAAIQNGKDDFNTACSDLESTSQLLYIDLSEMEGIYQTSTGTHQTIADLAGIGATNCLVFLPVGTSASNNNVAYKLEGGTFQAANDIELTDKQPFYTPYDIQVNAAKKAIYKRLITKDKYGKVQNASLILPFAITVDNNGTHKNLDGSEFSLHTMQKSSSLTLINGTTYAYFPGLSNVTITEANTPYLVQLTENSSEDGVSFVVSQSGAPIKATTAMASDYTFTGATSTGTATGGESPGTWNFTSKGTYAGAKIAKEENVFYFARNQFVNSGNLSSSYDYANIAPFRAYFASGSRTNGAKLSGFDIIFEEGFDHGGIATGMQTINAAELIDVNAPVYDIQGRMVATSYRELANKSKKLQSGLYVVNGVKFMIK